MKRQCVWYCKF
ncbi:hypothetical protein MQK27_17180 [Vibrio cholerae]|nr:hypothetical protein [Vibrio cholerae]MCO7034715.1 hypothetical protein [Vibrio paracholerae]MCU4229285.1 hypothetical protein [Vibrio cholerae]